MQPFFQTKIPLTEYLKRGMMLLKSSQKYITLSNIYCGIEKYETSTKKER